MLVTDFVIFHVELDHYTRVNSGNLHALHAKANRSWSVLPRQRILPQLFQSRMYMTQKHRIHYSQEELPSTGDRFVFAKTRSKLLRHHQALRTGSGLRWPSTSMRCQHIEDENVDDTRHLQLLVRALGGLCSLTKNLQHYNRECHAYKAETG